MHWRITLEAVDPTGDTYGKEFMIAKDLDNLFPECRRVSSVRRPVLPMIP